MKNMRPYTDFESYCANFPPDVVKILSKIRELAHKQIKNGVEVIRYAVPTIQVDGKNVLHFAAYAKHIALYPASDELVAKVPLLKKHRSGKGTFQFMLNQPIPYDLIAKIIEYRAGA